MKLFLIAGVGAALALGLRASIAAPVTVNNPHGLNDFSDGYFRPDGTIDMDAGFMKTINNIMLPRGIRNNNPGNLVITEIKWNGKVPFSENTDGKFEQFVGPVWGIRAMFMDVRGDIEKDGLDTIRKLITEYAPPRENNTAAYISSVSKTLGIGPDDRIMPAHYHKLLQAIILHENGDQPYSSELISEAMALA